MELYNKLSNSKSTDDQDAAKDMRPKKRYLVPHIVYKDEKGKEVDKEVGAKLALLTEQQYNSVLDLYLDPEQGDFTDPKNGYDIKYKRVGKGQFDTEYSVVPCRPSPLPKEFRKTYDLEKMVRDIIPTYEKSKEIKKLYLSGSETEEEERPKKKKKKVISSEKTGLKKKKKKKTV
jgi:hypothetical protein